ncbi:hypothetical protein Dimus_013245 [Dionaea muscipula]
MPARYQPAPLAGALAHLLVCNMGLHLSQATLRLPMLLHVLGRRLSQASTASSSSSSASHTNNYIHHFLITFRSSQTTTPQSLLQSHAFIIVTGNSNNAHIASKLISLYSSLADPRSVAKVFNSVQSKDTFLWNSIIKSCFSNGDYPQTLDLYQQMRLSNTRVNDFTIPMVASACAELLALVFGETVHGLVAKSGHFGWNAAVGSSFVYMYSKCGRMVDAYLVFDEMPIRDVVAWSALVMGYVQNGAAEMGLACLCEMHRLGDECERLNFRTLEGGFHACGDLRALREGRCLHGFALKVGLSCYHDVQSVILSMYSKCGAAEEAYFSFGEMGHEDVFCWTAVIAAYAKLGCMTECLGLFLSMQDAELNVDGIIMSCVISCFKDSTRVRQGKAFHGFITRRKYFLDQVAVNALISMYCRFGMALTAEKLFDRSHSRDSGSWNIMVCGYGKSGLDWRCIDMFREMRHQGLEYDLSSVISVISSCSKVGAIHLGRSLHSQTIKHLLDRNVSVSNSLIDMYGKYGKLTLARKIFTRTERDTVTWNTIISVYLRQGHPAEAVELFDKMVKEGSHPNSATLVIVMSACSQIASYEKTEMIHKYIKNTGVELNTSLATALLDAYGKCGKIETSRQVFNALGEKDVISWNAMISCYGMHGDARSAIEIFKQMEVSSVSPTGLTFLAVLSACNHAGLAEEGRYLFGKMHDYSVTPTLKHYACMIDLLGKSGNLKEAEDLVMSMPIAPDGGIWGSLLTAYKTHNDVEGGIRIASRATESDPGNDGYYIILSNMFDSIGHWEEAERIRELMKERGVRKSPGWSALKLAPSLLVNLDAWNVSFLLGYNNSLSAGDSDVPSLNDARRI